MEGNDEAELMKLVLGMQAVVGAVVMTLLRGKSDQERAEFLKLAQENVRAMERLIRGNDGASADGAKIEAWVDLWVSGQIGNIALFWKDG